MFEFSLKKIEQVSAHLRPGVLACRGGGVNACRGGGVKECRGGALASAVVWALIRGNDCRGKAVNAGDNEWESIILSMR